MTVLKGDQVKLRTGETGIVVEVWGIARTWLKVDTGGGHVICMADAVERVIKREKIKKSR